MYSFQPSRNHHLNSTNLNSNRPALRGHLRRGERQCSLPPQVTKPKLQTKVSRPQHGWYPVPLVQLLHRFAITRSGFQFPFRSATATEKA